MSMPFHAVLEAARTRAGMSFQDLWIAYFGLGGAKEPEALRAYLAGRGDGEMDANVVAQAINERFIDQGGDHPVPYGDDFA